MAEATEVASTETTNTEPTQTTPAQAAPAASSPGESLLPKSDATDTPEAKTDPANYLGSWKTREDAEKGLKELNGKLRSKAPAVEVPEAYDFKELIDQGIGFENEQHQAAVSTMLKEAGMTQAQIAKLGPLSKEVSERAFKAGQSEVMAKVIENYGEPPDRETELTALKTAWGDKFEAEMNAVSAFSKTIDPVLARDLSRTAAGVLHMREYQKLTRGADFITDSETGGHNDAVRKSEILSDPNYREANAKGEALRAELLRINARLTGETR